MGAALAAAAVLCCILAPRGAQATSLAGQELEFTHFRESPDGRVVFDSASFQVGPGPEHVTPFLIIDASATEVVLVEAGLIPGNPIQTVFSSVMEFEILGSPHFTMAIFDQGRSTFSGNLDPSRLQVENRLLRIDLRGLSSPAGGVLVTQVEVVPEPGTGGLVAMGVLVIAVSRFGARCLTRRCS